MLASVLFSLLFTYTFANSCCTKPLTVQDAYQQSEVVFRAAVKDGYGTATLTLEVSEVFKGTNAHTALLQEGLIHAKQNCPQLPVAKGGNGVFFGTVTQSSHGVVAVSLRVCDPNGELSQCDLTAVRTGEFGRGCTSPPHVPTPSTPSSESCPSQCATSSTYRSGTFNCEICTCSRETRNGVATCVSSCKMSSTCVLAPSIIGSCLLVVAFICVMIAIRRRRRLQAETSEVELSDISDAPDVSQNYAYQPVMTSPPMMTNSQVMMTTPQGNVLVNTQPMYMMTQTGEPVVVQVAYL